ncbi:hypothetical protein HDU67_008107 [Dinochytrium kinnereticum]|nr:hypothetical protein HDU67_008107 [Dinochytrium kinnereticum]
MQAKEGDATPGTKQLYCMGVDKERNRENRTANDFTFLEPESMCSSKPVAADSSKTAGDGQNNPPTPGPTAAAAHYPSSREIMSKVSSAKGKRGSVKSAQKYQNTFAFQPSKHNPHAIKLAAIPVQGLCGKCVDIIEWRKRMGQYKPLTVPKKCVACSEKAIKDAYHILCRNCALNKGVCAKCQKAEEIEPNEAARPASDVQREKQVQENLIASMPERYRRSYLRKMERGDEAGAQAIAQKAAGMAQDEFSDDDGFDDDFDESDVEE